MSDDPSPLNPPEPGYLNVLRAHSLLSWLPLLAGAVVLDRIFLADGWAAGIAPLLLAVAGTIAVLVVPRRVFRRLGWRITGEQLQAVRGWLVHVDTIVPLVRVQHIDVSRGPFEKMFGTATLIVHTAGTHNSVVTLPGLSPDQAAGIRDEIRRHIRTDFE